MSRTTFADQAHQMWNTRPVRLPRQGPIAGVAAGFGARYGIDPVLLRVAFVVSTIFGGAGIVLYLLAWLVLGSAGNETSAAEALTANERGTHSQTKTIVLIVALAIAVSTMGPIGLGLGGSGVLGMGLMLAGWWMLYLRHPELPVGLDTYRAPLGATGYPGAGYPSGAPTHGYPYTPDVPSTGMYTPYTTLPDAYVPDPATTVLPREENRTAAAESTPLLRVDATETVVLHKDADETADDTERLTAPPAETAPSAPDTESASGANVSAAQTGPAAPEQADTDANATESPRPHQESVAATESPIDLAKRDTPPTENSVTPESDDDARATTVLRKEPPHSRPGPSAPEFRAQVPNGWDPLAVAPLAWELPTAAPQYAVAVPPPATKRPRSRLTPITIGLAILAAAAAGAAAASGVEWMTPARIAAFALAVIGLGLIAGAFLRRGYGLLVLTAPLAGFVLLASLLGPIEFDGATMGDHTWTPSAAADLQPRYTLNMGSATLDLRELTLTESRSVEVSVNMGEATVLLPEGMTVNTTCDVSAGEMSCPDGLSGPQTPDAPVLDLRVEANLGEVKVTRG